MQGGERIHQQHYAFLVGEDEFDQIHGRSMERGLLYWADTFYRQPQQINNDREIITAPYGGSSTSTPAMP
jgi:hypothetical protein